MRKIALAAIIASAALNLTACSDRAEDVTTEEANGAADPAVDAGAAEGIAAEAIAEVGGPLDANSANEEQLAGADGVTPELANAVAAGRPYANVVELEAKLRETLSDEALNAVLVNVFVPVDLNKATREEIELIPGMTSRMVGEFLEYRPYENMAEFEREIGKYVNEAEVARLRSYVTL